MEAGFKLAQMSCPACMKDPGGSVSVFIIFPRRPEGGGSEGVIPSYLIIASFSGSGIQLPSGMRPLFGIRGVWSRRAWVPYQDGQQTLGDSSKHVM